MSDLTILIARARAATESDRFLDADIHTTLFGAVNAAPVGLTYRDAFDPILGYAGPYHFTGHVEGAEMALPGPEWPEYQITRRFPTGYHANVGMGADGPGHETAALALLVAALEARATPPAKETGR